MMQTVLPNLGPGALTGREDPNKRASNVTTSSLPLFVFFLGVYIRREMKFSVSQRCFFTFDARNCRNVFCTVCFLGEFALSRFSGHFERFFAFWFVFS